MSNYPRVGYFTDTSKMTPEELKLFLRYGMQMRILNIVYKFDCLTKRNRKLFFRNYHKKYLEDTREERMADLQRQYEDADY